METFVISGSDGFLGSSILKSLQEKNTGVIKLGKELDVSRVQIESHLRENGPLDLMFVLAGWSGVSGELHNDLRTQKKSFNLFCSQVDLAIELGAKHILGIGSMAEYAYLAHTGHSPTSYSKFKAMAGQYLESKAAAKDVAWSWARLFKIYGPNMPKSWTISRVAGVITGALPATLKLDTRETFLHTDDVLRALMLALGLDGGLGYFDLAHPGPPNLIQTIEEFWLVERIRKDRFVEIIQEDSRYYNPAELGKISNLGWYPKVNLLDQLRSLRPK